MENIINTMIERINSKITYEKQNFTRLDNLHSLRMARIKGMVEMLSIATGKNYIIAEDGLKEE